MDIAEYNMHEKCLQKVVEEFGKVSCRFINHYSARKIWISGVKFSPVPEITLVDALLLVLNLSSCLSDSEHILTSFNLTARLGNVESVGFVFLRKGKQLYEHSAARSLKQLYTMVSKPGTPQIEASKTSNNSWMPNQRPLMRHYAKHSNNFTVIYVNSVTNFRLFSICQCFCNRCLKVAREFSAGLKSGLYAFHAFHSSTFTIFLGLNC